MMLKPRRDGSIFVSIASFRDKECPRTIESIYAKAAHPERIFCGVCQQNDPAKGDPDCKLTAAIKPEFKPKIRIVRMSDVEATGPVFARWMCAQQYGGEEFFMQVDSHSRFRQDWDINFIRDLKILQETGTSAKPILSVYPGDWDPASKKPIEDHTDEMPTMMCRAFWSKEGLLSFDGAQGMPPPDNGIPRRHAFIAGGFLMAPAEILEVSYDPLLPQLFVMEEILQSARYWTHGWDVFSPTKNAILHYYSRPKEPKFWDLPGRPSDQDAVQKAKFLLKLDDRAKVADHLNRNLDRYGLGKVRTLQSFWEHTGIKPDEKVVTKSFCRPDGKNVNDISYEATRKPKTAEGFELEAFAHDAGDGFALVEGFLDENGYLVVSAPRPYTEEKHRKHVMMLIALLLLATIAAWIWLSLNSKTGTGIGLRPS